MMVLHVFEESHRDDRDDHLEFWFGYPEFGPEYDEESDTQLCYCGADLVVMERNEFGEITVAAMWHRMRFDPKFFLEEWHEDE
jgi:hypothetical protein